MSIQGELSISLNPTDEGINTQINSTRPSLAAQIFIGKTIDQTLNTIPLLFSICAKAQVNTVINAIESDGQISPCDSIISQREATVLLECLREYCIQVLMIWPTFISPENTSNTDKNNVKTNNVNTNNANTNTALAKLLQSINGLIQSFDSTTLFTINDKENIAISEQQIEMWQQCKRRLNECIFTESLPNFQKTTVDEILLWSSEKKSTTASFINWLNKQPWKYEGSSNINLLPDIDDDAFKRELLLNNKFSSTPQWQSKCYELSWFNRAIKNTTIQKLEEEKGNGIFTRAIARIAEISYVISELNEFFFHKKILKNIKSSTTGLAHTQSARGKLTHYIEVEKQKIKHFTIVAPTEWNFHSEGVVAKSLSALKAGSKDKLTVQAKILISMIDPCVGYQLAINEENK